MTRRRRAGVGSGIGAVALVAAVASVAACRKARRPDGARQRPPAAPRAAGSALPVVRRVELQPLRHHARRVVETLAALGAPLAPDEHAALERAATVEDIQAVLDRRALVGVHINPEARVRATPGPAAPLLDEDGFRPFLVKVVNEAGVTAELRVESPQAGPIRRVPGPYGHARPDVVITPEDVRERWLGAELHARPPLRPELSGLEVEYRVLLLYCSDRDLGATLSDRDRGDGGAIAPRPPGAARRRAATLAFHVGPGTADLGFRSGVDVLFTCRPAVDVRLRVLDEHGAPAMASFLVRDAAGRTYPPRARRLAPDFFFQQHVYRSDGEALALPPGEYTVTFGRGPEYVTRTRALRVPAPGARRDAAPVETFRLERWVDPASAGWISGDHHLHAAGCAHYDNPTEGVLPEDMWRHVLGEDLRVGAVLTWGPCYYFQRRFFAGRALRLADAYHALRYDVEVSGFGSHRAGHLVLLGLAEQDYPGARAIEDWPHLGLSVLRWAKAQGAVTGAAHSGWGLEVPGTDLPNYALPRFDGIGANEFVVQVTHEVPGPDGAPVPAVDFLSAGDTPYVWELNVFYHALNAGLRPRLAGESDFPCIYEDRVGAARSYVRLDDAPRVDFDAWREGLRRGRAYVSDGRSHLIDFAVDGVEPGAELRLRAPGAVRVRVRVAALLDPVPRPELRDLPYTQQPYWHLERARIGDGREVPLELVVDGRVVARRPVPADGALREVVFDAVPVARSSWVAARILPSAHTNPVFVVVNDRPVRADRRSAEWLLRAVDACWTQKSPTYRPDELPAARAAYDHARRVYRTILSEMPPP